MFTVLGDAVNPAAELFIWFEMQEWSVDGRIKALCVRSPALRELYRQEHTQEQAGKDGPYQLDRLWEAAGKPADKAPAAWPGLEGTELEDRGPGGVWGDFEAAIWYAQHLDERIGPDDVCSIIY